MSRPAEQQLELEVVRIESPRPSRVRANGSLRGESGDSVEPSTADGVRAVNARSRLKTTEARSTNAVPGGNEAGDSSPFLLVEEVARRLRCSRRTIHELTRTNAIPHRRLAGSRRCLFRMDELEAWENGSSLQVRELPRGGRIVTPGAPDSNERFVYTTNLPLSRRAASFSALRDQAP